jgi:hypothetical protein
MLGYGNNRGVNTKTTAVLTKPRSVSCSSQTDLTANDVQDGIIGYDGSDTEMRTSSTSGLNNAFRRLEV